MDAIQEISEHGILHGITTYPCKKDIDYKDKIRLIYNRVGRPDLALTGTCRYQDAASSQNQ